MQTLIASVQKEAFWLQAEPNWPVIASEWSDDYEYNNFVRIYCDLETKSTFAVSVGNGLETLLGDSIVWNKEPDIRSWCGYEWQANGDCFTLSYGPEADYEWWSINDILFGELNYGYLGAVHGVTHCVISVPEIVKYFKNSNYCTPLGAARGVIEYWWHELTPAEEVQYGLTVAEIEDEYESFEELHIHPYS